MIKGVNKQVLEIAQTDNNFFEKAIFFVKPEYMGMSEGKLREQAKNEMNVVGCPVYTKTKNHLKIKNVALLGGVFILGLIFGLILSSF